MESHAGVVSLLLSLFSADELRRLLRYQPDGDLILAQLPGATVSPAAFAFAAVQLLAQRGDLEDRDFWERLIAERPRRRAEIERVRDAIVAGAGPAAARPRAAPAPSILTVLLVTAHSEPALRGSADAAFDQFVEKLQRSRQRGRLRFVRVPTDSLTGLRGALLEHEPQVLHLGCTADDDGSLLFPPAVDDGAPARVAGGNLVRLLGALGGLQLAVIAGPHATAVARQVGPAVGLSVGLGERVGQRAAIEFAVAFYETLAFGKSVETAFAVAAAGLGDGDDAPQLFPPRTQDPELRRERPLVRGGPS